MASIKISDLNNISVLSDDDVLPIVNDTDTKKVSIAQLADRFGGSGGTSSDIISLTEDTDMRDKVTGLYKNGSSGSIRLKIASSGKGTIYINATEYVYWNNATLSLGSAYTNTLICLDSGVGSTLRFYIVHNDSGSLYSIDATTVVSTNAAQTISGVKTFTSLPISTVVPTNDNQLSNKKYIDDTISNKFWIGTQIEYDALGSYSDTTLYFIKEDTNASE